jgi:3-dehydroquinate dehydratase
MRVAAKFACLLLLLATGALFAAAPDKPSLQTLRARADGAQGQDCAEVCLDAAQALVEDSNQQFTDGKPDLGHQEMKDAVDYAVKATRGSIQSNKRQKKTEIGLRKLSRRMTDIRQTLAIDDRPPVDELIKIVEKMRTDLLMSMFDEKK